MTKNGRVMQKIPLAVPNLEGDEAALLQVCIESTFVSSVGPFVTEFENRIATLSGVAQAAVVCTGTVALQMALEGLGIGAGDLVIMPSLTFIATSNAISHSGAAPWLVDVTADTWTLDLALCRRLIEVETDPNPGGKGRIHRASGQILRALAPVMVMGATLDFDAIVALARDFDLHVVVDAAAAVGGKGAGDVGLAATGVDAVCYSFNGNKTVTCGGGGAVAAVDPVLIQRIKHLTTTGRVGGNYDHDVIGYNFRMTNVQAAIGVAQLRRLDAFLAAKTAHHAAYTDLAAAFPVLKPFPELDQGRSTYWFSGFHYTGKDMALCDAFRAHMNDAGVDLRMFWKPIHLQAPYAGTLQSPMLVSTALWERIFPLPCSTHLTVAERSLVLDAARQFWSDHA